MWLVQTRWCSWRSCYDLSHVQYPPLWTSRSLSFALNSLLGSAKTLSRFDSPPWREICLAQLSLWLAHLCTADCHLLSGLQILSSPSPGLPWNSDCDHSENLTSYHCKHCYSWSTVTFVWVMMAMRPYLRPDDCCSLSNLTGHLPACSYLCCYSLVADLWSFFLQWEASKL